MIRALIQKVLPIVLSCMPFPVTADVVHKWVDSQGITHYSDQPPDSSATPVSQIDLPEYYAVVDVENDYFSISNQWRRLFEERIERDRLKLEMAKSKAAQQPPPPQIVTIDSPQVVQSYSPYPWIYWPYHRYPHAAHPRKIEQPQTVGRNARLHKENPNDTQPDRGRLVGSH